jgi:UDP-glucuronate decarboxylase
MHIERRVVVTGAAGFIGSHLCEHLLAKGCHVLCVDNFFSGTKQNIEHLLDNSHFEVLRHDVTVPLYVEADEIYNLVSCLADPLPARPGANHQDVRAWRNQHARP